MTQHKSYYATLQVLHALQLHVQQISTIFYKKAIQIICASNQLFYL